MKGIIKIRKLICMLIIFLTLIMASSVSHAVTSYWISAGGGGDYDLLGSRNIYCLDQHTFLTPTRVRYYVQAHIHIEGRKATGSVNSNSTTNAQMAYILAHNTGDFMGHGSRGNISTRQCVIWYYSATWLNSIGLGGYAHAPGYEGRTTGYEAYWNGKYRGAREYASKVDSLDEVYTADIYIVRSKNSTQDLMITRTGTLKQTGDLSVLKTDKDLNKNGLRMGFKVETKVDGKTYWLELNGNTYNYKGSTGTTFYTDNGQKDLKGLSVKNEYRIWETVAPSKYYKLEDQDGYDSSRKAVRLSDWFKVKTSQTTKVVATNKPRVSISGYVWIDKTQKGESTTDSLYRSNTGDVRLKDVPVMLVRKSDNKVIKTAKTNANGEYVFEEAVLYRDLNNYYIKFDYSSMTIEGRSGNEYIPVAYSSSNLKNVVRNGSRAMMNEVATKDTDLKGIATTYAGTNSNYLKTYSLKALADNTQNSSSERLFDGYSLKFINLGIKAIYQPNYSLYEDLEYVKIVLNNHEYVYKYGLRKDSDAVGAPKVGFQNPAIGTYERPIYPSAIYDLAEGKNTDGQIKVYAVYGIKIINNTDHNEKELYQEQVLHITSLVNTFDTNRYEFSGDVASVQGASKEFLELENQIKNDFNQWEVKDNTAKYKSEIKVKNGTPEKRYIQFKIKDNEILNILNNQDGLTEKNPTTAKTWGYHEYKRDDYSWKNIPNMPKSQTHISKEQICESEAPYLKFILGKERKVTGTVFEDLIDMTGRQEGEVLGNGRYDKSTEKPVNGVIVEIISGNQAFDSEEAKVTKVYIGSEDKKTYTIQDALTKTNANGEFSIEGIMPGDYYIRLTYGDGTQKIMNSDGTVVSIDEYKSTIVTNEAARNALGYAENKYGKEWYKHLESDIASVAIDSLRLRAEHTSGNIQSRMLAGTALIDITIENTENNYTSAEEALNKETFYGFNFGIIVQPKQRLGIEKKITNVKLINTPNVLFNGNPQTDNMPGVTDLDGVDENQGSTYTRMEVEQENIYGSEITLTYNIEVKNISDVNYYEADENYKGWYYMFGDYSHSTPVKEEVKEVIDCYDPVLRYISNYSYVTTIQADSLGRWGERENTINKIKAIANVKQDKYDYKEALLITDWKVLERNESDNKTIEFNKILSTENDDLDYIGVAAINKANNTVAEGHKTNTFAAETLKYAKPVILPEPALAEATVTTPTGSLQYIIMATTGIIGVAILGSIAFIVVKKKKSK